MTGERSSDHRSDSRTGGEVMRVAPNRTAWKHTHCVMTHTEPAFPCRSPLRRRGIVLALPISQVAIAPHKEKERS
jgi:hypothetical protein